MVTGRNGAGKSSLAAHDRRADRTSPPDASSLDGGEPEATVAEQAHYLGHQDALKPSLVGGRKPDVLDRISWAAARRPSEPALEAVDLAPLADLPAAYLSAGQRRRLSIARLLAVPSARSGCSTSRPPRSTRRRKTRLAGLMRDHLAGGGMIVAAAHGPIGLERRPRTEVGAAHERIRGRF